MSKVLKLESINYDSQLEEAAKALREGKLVVFPTETVYGIGANALNETAVKNIFKAKNRPADNPLIVHIATKEQAYPLVKDFNYNAQLLADKFWPGPLTIVLEKTNIIPDIVSAGMDSIAIRIPNHKLALDLINMAGVPVAAPSANLSGSPSPTTLEHVVADLDGRVDYILDGGETKVGIESTVVLLTPQIPVLLRPGGVTLEELQEVLGEVKVSSAVLNSLTSTEQALSPGLKHKHYSPKTEVVLVEGSRESFIKFCNDSTNKMAAAIVFEEEVAKIKIPTISYGKRTRPNELAHNLFSALREADKLNASVIYVHAPTPDGIGLAVYNRLLRAADFKKINLDFGGNYEQ